MYIMMFNKLLNCNSSLNLVTLFVTKYCKILDIREPFNLANVAVLTKFGNQTYGNISCLKL